jgi:hypothetical protein
MLRFVFWFLCFITVACNQKKRIANPAVEIKAPSLQQDSLSQTNKKISDVSDTTLAIDSITTVALHNGTAIVKGRLNGAGTQAVIVFTINSGSELKAHVKPTIGTGNIRINQIQLPDKTLDGPFGQELAYPIMKKGVYKLIIGENLMAEGNWKGDYILTIKTF